VLQESAGFPDPELRPEREERSWKLVTTFASAFYSYTTVQDFIITYHCGVQDFLTQSSGLSPEERARVLEADDDICRGHDDAAQEGQTAAPPRDESIDYHFIAFVQVTQRCQLAENSAAVPKNGPKKKFLVVEILLNVYEKANFACLVSPVFLGQE